MSLHMRCDHLAELYQEKLEEEESRNAALKRANVQLRNVYQVESKSGPDYPPLPLHRKNLLQETPAGTGGDEQMNNQIKNVPN